MHKVNTKRQDTKMMRRTSCGQPPVATPEAYNWVVENGQYKNKWTLFKKNNHIS